MIWLMLFLYLILANLPWVGNQLFLVVPLAEKKVWVRLLELIVYYFLSLLLGIAFEQHFSGDVYEQQWEFFVTTLSLFLVLSVPGVIFRYQWMPLTRQDS